ncbi:hypothetical protein [Siphonobacter sp. BAB-5385]|uniref:hypothetical protein n=1 Tax=Siphonobacter sp. BAB-5385 TaxID=1864822 RepID=UPI0011408333|nr:hypothetical protein [Siphonobacter sp. BAB-5385]
MKNYPFTILFFLLTLLLSCKKEGVEKSQKCVKVLYNREYCQKDLHQVLLLEPNEDATVYERSDTTKIYLMSLVNLPDSLIKSKTPFYLKYHVDQKITDRYKSLFCTTDLYPSTINVFNGASSTSCQ